MTASRRTYEFGPFVLDGRRRRLLRDGEPLALSPKVLETLLALVEHRDRVITKDELLKRIWGDTIVEEGGLTRNVSLLRKLLGETPDDHRFIVTVPSRGYRFVAEVRETNAERGEDEAGLALSLPPETPRTDVRMNRRVLSRRWVAIGGAAALAFVLLGYLFRPLASAILGAPKIESIAVLPLENMSGDPAHEYLADGMTEALIGNLARIRSLRVVSRTSVMRFKGARPSIQEIGRALGVDAIVEGSVQRTAEKVRVNIQMIHAATDTHLFAREYERRLTDVLALQSDVARAVANEIRVQLTAEDRAAMSSAAGTTNAAAHQEFLLGRYYLWKRLDADLVRAISHFERATRIDPGYAAAYAGISHAWWWRGIIGPLTLKDVESPSRTAALRAAELDPRLPEAHVSMGRLKYGHDWDWTGAERDFSRALELDPHNVDAHFFSGMLLMALGRFNEAVEHMERAAELDPLSSTVQSGFGRVLYRARRFDDAIVRLNHAIELEPRNAGAYVRLADVYEEMGRYADALALHEKARQLSGEPAMRSLSVARILARSGRPTEARQALAANRHTSRADHMLQQAYAYAALGDADEAFRLLFRNLETHDEWAAYTKTDPRLDVLHSDPRWAELLRRLNLAAGNTPAAR